MNTLENNKLIAEFMQISYREQQNAIVETSEFLEKGYNKGARFIFLDYHSDWNYLMPVIEKIESLKYWTEIVGGTHHSFRIGAINQTTVFIIWDSETKIEAVYNAVVDFITRYNSADEVFKRSAEKRIKTKTT